MSTQDTPAGPFMLVVDDDGAVLASGWTADVAELLPLIHRDLRAEPARRSELGAATKAVAAYHQGDLTAPDSIEVRQRTGGPFLTAAWKLLRDVTPGHPISYTELAARTGNPTANRAAAQACARDAAALFVPCHRIVRTDGSLGGFRYGINVKQWLLTHEAATYTT